MEAEVERRRIPYAAGDTEISLDIRVLMGRHWIKLLTKNGFDHTVREAHIRGVGTFEPDPSNRDHSYYCPNQQSWQKHAASAGRLVDGKRLYDDIVLHSGTHVVTKGADLTLYGDLIALGERFVMWFDEVFLQPDSALHDAWLPPCLEYQFQCSAPVEGEDKVFNAQE